MKKILLLLTLVSAQCFAIEPELQQVNEEFGRLSQLEIQLEQNPELSIEEVVKAFPELEGQMEISSSTFLTDGGNGNTLGIPPFFWGCVFGLLGILAVYIISDNDKAATKKALIGCLVTYGTFAVVYIVIWIVALSSVATY